jgi:uncharacterized protein YpmS
MLFRRRLLYAILLAGAITLIFVLALFAGLPCPAESPHTADSRALAEALTSLPDLPPGSPVKLQATSEQLATLAQQYLGASSRAPLGDLNVQITTGQMRIDACLRRLLVVPVPLHARMTVRSDGSGRLTLAVDALQVGRLHLPAPARQIIAAQIEAALDALLRPLVIDEVRLEPDLLLLRGRRVAR